MTVRTLWIPAIAVSLGLAGLAQAQPAPLNNQQLADAVAARLKSSAKATGANFDVDTVDGTVVLSGTVVSEEQARQLVKEVMGVRGALKVRTALKVQDVRQASDIEPPIPVLPPTAPLAESAETGPGQLTTGGPFHHMGQEPLPLGAPAQPSYDQTGPKLPTHAWPTYAPYPNLSRVAYPEAYPYNAFPFIGPFYPFPKVPLGWRSVKMEWDDGHWYIGRLSTPYSYWRVRTW